MADMNEIIRVQAQLEGSNYILHPSPNHNYWANISAGRLQEYIARCGEQFNLVIVGSNNDEGDFYAVPFPVLKHALTDEFLSTDKTGRRRWVATIKNHQLKIGRCPFPIDVGAYFGSRAALTRPGAPEPTPPAELNDYAIANRKIEIEQRQKQSTFRKRVMENFEGRCCLSDINEEEVLVASHIVPWARRIESRLDPANGLLMYCPYDRFFDKGIISFDDELRVMVVPWIGECSPALRQILGSLDGRQARTPTKWPIKRDYLAYHRSTVFRRQRIRPVDKDALRSPDPLETQ
jgi:putative restriction endonuclease